MNDISIDKAQIPEPNPAMSFPARLAGIIFSPQETMVDLSIRPRIAFPIVAMVLALPLFYILRYPMFVEFTRKIMEASMQGQAAQLPPGQLDALMQWIPAVQIGTAPISVLISWVIVAAIFFGLIKLFKGEGRFVQLLSITGYAYTIYMLYLLVSLLVSFFSGELMLNDSLALLAPGLQGSYMYGLLRGIDFFGLWRYIVIIIGITAVSKLNYGKSIGIVALVYIPTVLIEAFSLKWM